MSFWEDERRMDEAQEQELAKLEGRPFVRVLRSRPPMPLESITDESRARMVISGYDPQTARRALCHDRPNESHGLCDPCNQFAKNLRDHWKAGRLDELEIRRRVRERAQLAS